MKPRPWKPLASILVVVSAAVAMTWVLFARPGPVPLDRSPFLADIVEPITIVKGISWSDGGSQGLTFTDSRGVSRSVCMEHTLGGGRTLVFGALKPDGKSARRVLIAGIEERAFLGLLERWKNSDREARQTMALINRRDRGEIDWEFYQSTVNRDSEIALSLLRSLQQDRTKPVRVR